MAQITRLVMSQEQASKTPITALHTSQCSLKNVTRVVLLQIVLKQVNRRLTMTSRRKIATV